MEKIEREIFSENIKNFIDKENKQPIIWRIIFWICFLIISIEIVLFFYILGGFFTAYTNYRSIKNDISFIEEKLTSVEKNNFSGISPIKESPEYGYVIDSVLKLMPTIFNILHIKASDNVVKITLQSSSEDITQSIDKFFTALQKERSINNIKLESIQENIINITINMNDKDSLIQDENIKKSFETNAKKLDVKVLLPAPISLIGRGEAISPNDGRILLTWKGPSEVAEWLVFAAREPNKWSLAGVSPTNEYIFRTSETNTTWYFKVLGVSADGKRTKESKSISITAGENIKPGLVKNIKVNREKKTNGTWEITLGWDPVPYAWRYWAYQGNDKEDIKLLGLTDKNSITFDSEFAEVPGKFHIIAESVDGIMGY